MCALSRVHRRSRGASLRDCSSEPSLSGRSAETLDGSNAVCLLPAELTPFPCDWVKCLFWSSRREHGTATGPCASRWTRCTMIQHVGFFQERLWFFLNSTLACRRPRRCAVITQMPCRPQVTSISNDYIHICTEFQLTTSIYFARKMVLVVIYLPSVLVVCVSVFSFLVEMVG